MTTKKCEVTTCTTRVPHDSLMCLPHWKRVSKNTKARYYEAKTAFKAHRLSAGIYQSILDMAKKEAVA